MQAPPWRCRDSLASDRDTSGSSEHRARLGLTWVPGIVSLGIVCCPGQVVRNDRGWTGILDRTPAKSKSAMVENLIERLQRAAEIGCHGSGPAHDFLHVLRVTASARRIGLIEGADLEVVVPAALLHELFNYPKGHPHSHLSGDTCAERAGGVLRQNDCPAQLIAPIQSCIRVHAFSRGLVPETIEGKVLQDADRLDAIGAIGIARCFATCAEMGVPFYNADDPFCIAREPDDKRWGLDHFYRKLLRIPEGLHTATARAIADDRIRIIQAFLAQLGQEIHGEEATPQGPSQSLWRR
jgi:uncharacterized protein